MPESTLQHPSAPVSLQEEGAFEQSLQIVLSIQANPQHEDAEGGLISAQYTTAEYAAADERGQLAAQPQLHFIYPTSQTMLERAKSILTPTKKKQQPGGLPSPGQDSDGEHTPTQRRRR
jgi:hypothetical protein